MDVVIAKWGLDEGCRRRIRGSGFDALEIIQVFFPELYPVRLSITCNARSQAILLCRFHRNVHGLR